MERVSLLSSERERIVRLIMSENLVQVSSSSPNAGRASEVVPTCRYSGEPLSIHFNVGYVLQQLEHVEVMIFTSNLQAN